MALNGGHVLVSLHLLTLWGTRQTRVYARSGDIRPAFVFVTKETPKRFLWPILAWPCGLMVSHMNETDQESLTTERENVLFMTEGAMMANAAIHKARASATSEEPHVSLAGMMRDRGVAFGRQGAIQKGLFLIGQW